MDYGFTRTTTYTGLLEWRCRRRTLPGRPGGGRMEATYCRRGLVHPLFYIKQVLLHWWLTQFTRRKIIDANSVQVEILYSHYVENLTVLGVAIPT